MTLMMLRLALGSRSISKRLRVEARKGSKVSSTGTSSVTVTVCACVPMVSVKFCVDVRLVETLSSADALAKPSFEISRR